MTVPEIKRNYSYTTSCEILEAAATGKVFSADETTNAITSTAHGFADGDRIIFRDGDAPRPLASDTVYFVRDKTNDTFKLAETSGGTALDLSASGTGELYAVGPMDLTGATAKFVVEGEEFAAVVEVPETQGEVSIDMTPAQTLDLDRGRRQAWFKVVLGGETNYYGEHFVEVID